MTISLQSTNMKIDASLETNEEAIDVSLDAAYNDIQEEKQHRLLEIEEIEESEDDETDSTCFPIHEIQSLKERGIGSSAPRLDLNLFKHKIKLELIGIFPTTRFLEDVTMPPDVKELFGGTPFFALGEYRVAFVELEGQLLTIIVNKGVVGMGTGYWGGCYQRNFHSCVATFTCEGQFPVQPVLIKEQRTRQTKNFFTKLDQTLSGKSCYFEKNATELEQLLGVIVDFLLHLDWHKLLPPSLIEIQDKSSRNLRKQRADKKLMTTTKQKLQKENILL